MNLKDKIQELARQNESQILEVRRTIHQNPELSFEEFETQKFLKKEVERNWN